MALPKGSDAASAVAVYPASFYRLPLPAGHSDRYRRCANILPGPGFGLETEGIDPIPSLEDSRDQIEEILTQRRIDQALDQWMSDTRKQVPVSFRDATLRDSTLMSRRVQNYRVQFPRRGLRAIAVLARVFGAQVGLVQEQGPRKNYLGSRARLGDASKSGLSPTNWRALTADVSPFTLHGTEPATAAPLLRADKIQVRLRIISLFEKKVDIASLFFESPR